VSAVELLLDLNASFVRNNEGSTCFTEAIINHNREVALAIVQVLQFRVKRRSDRFISNIPFLKSKDIGYPIRSGV